MIENNGDNINENEISFDDRTMIIMVGNIGTGKTSKIKQIIHKFGKYIIVCLDDLLTCFHGKYKYIKDFSLMYNIIEDSIIYEAMKNNSIVIIDRTCINERVRKRFIQMAKDNNYNVACYNFGSGTDVSLKRRLVNPKGNSEDTWITVHNNMNKIYEAPLLSEGIDEIFTVNEDGIVTRREKLVKNNNHN